MRSLAPALLLALFGCRGIFEEHDETLDADKDGAIYSLDCDSQDGHLYYRLWYRDRDLDGFGDPSTLVDSCDAPDSDTAWVRNGLDCNDNDTNAAIVRKGYLDIDSDGFGVGEAQAVCDATTPLADADGDCDDADATISPAAEAVCGNAADDNCDDLPDCDGLDGDVEVTERGARVEGLSTEGLGAALVNAGDINGDGHDDLVLGAPGQDGTVYALLGPVDSEGSASTLASARLLGDDRAAAGSALSGLGDVDGDGYADFLVGAPEAGDGGNVYLVPGPIRAVNDEDGDATLDLGRDVVKLATDEEAVGLGTALLGPGDVLGEDGVADLVVGAPEAGAGSGAVWVSDGLLGEDTVVEDESIRIEGAAFCELGTTMATLQDIDGDGVHELALGAPGYGVTEMVSPWRAPDPLGAVYVVSQVEDARVGGIADAQIVGDEVYNGFASALADAGDVDGDGYGDLLVSAPDADYSAGKVWLFSGAVIAEGGEIALEDAMAVIEGSEDEVGVGTSLTSVGDLNMDGAPEVLIGAARASFGESKDVGFASLWYGPLTGTLNSNAADAHILGDNSQKGQFGYAMTATTDGTLAIGAPMSNWGSVDEADSDEGFAGFGTEYHGIPGGGSGGILDWGSGYEWGDGAVYIIHAGY